MGDSGFWILDSGFWILDSGFWILDSGFWILDSGCWILDMPLAACVPTSSFIIPVIREIRVIRGQRAPLLRFPFYLQGVVARPS
jgi:hypothetical protein